MSAEVTLLVMEVEEVMFIQVVVKLLLSLRRWELEMEIWLAVVVVGWDLRLGLGLDLGLELGLGLGVDCVRSGGKVMSNADCSGAGLAVSLEVGLEEEMDSMPRLREGGGGAIDVVVLAVLGLSVKLG